MTTTEAPSIEALTPEVLFAQAAEIGKMHGYLTVGSVGRAACFGDAREFDARGESWLIRQSGVYRDIDVLTPVLMETLDPATPFKVDQCLKRAIGVFREGGLWVVRDSDVGLEAELSDDIFEPEHKTMFGSEITVPNIRTMLYLHLTAGACRKKDEVAKALIEELLADDPTSALPLEKYVEFDAFLNERNKRLVHRVKKIYHRSFPKRFKNRITPFVQKVREFRDQ